MSAKKYKIKKPKATTELCEMARFYITSVREIISEYQKNISSAKDNESIIPAQDNWGQINNRLIQIRQSFGLILERVKAKNQDIIRKFLIELWPKTKFSDIKNFEAERIDFQGKVIVIFADLNIDNPNITELPENLEIMGNLRIELSGIKKLPTEIFIDGNLTVSAEQKEQAEELKKQRKINGNIIVDKF